jgi:hypothetical protein
VSAGLWCGWASFGSTVRGRELDRAVRSPRHAGSARSNAPRRAEVSSRTTETDHASAVPAPVHDAWEDAARGPSGSEPPLGAERRDARGRLQATAGRTTTAQKPASTRLGCAHRGMRDTRGVRGRNARWTGARGDRGVRWCDSCRPILRRAIEIVGRDRTVGPADGRPERLRSVRRGLELAARADGEG